MSGILGLAHHVGILFGSDIHKVVVHRILRLILETHLVVQVRTGGLAG